MGHISNSSCLLVIHDRSKTDTFDLSQIARKPQHPCKENMYFLPFESGTVHRMTTGIGSGAA